MPRLHNKTALITGGTSGIGLATAHRFVEEGARVAITGTDPAHLEEAQHALGSEVIVLRADAGDVGGQREVARHVERAFGTLDALFVNAGIIDFRPLEHWGEAAFDRSVEVNLKGRSFWCRHCCRFSPAPPRSCSIPRSTRISARRIPASTR